MWARDKDRLSVFVRRTALAVLLAVVGVLVYHVGFRRERPSASVPGKPPAGTRLAGVKEDVRHLEYKDGNAWLDVRGDRSFLGDDGSTRLEGNVRIVDRRGERGSEMVITAGQVSFDKDLSLFVFSGGVEIREGEAVLESPSFEYDKGRGSVRTDSGASYASPGLSGSSQTFLYDLEGDILLLSNGFRLEIPGDGSASAGSVLNGGALRYERGRRRGEAGGGVAVRSGGFRGSSKIFGFELDGDEGSLRAATMSGRAKAEFRASSLSTDETAAQAVEADVIQVELRPGTSVISEFRSLGSSVLSVAFPEGSEAVVRGEIVRMAFDIDGSLLEFEVSEGAKADLSDEDEGKRTVTGQAVGYGRDSGALTVTGGGGEPARLESRTFGIEALSVSLEVATEELRAAGDVKGVFHPGTKERRIGFFEPGSSVFFTCGEFGRSQETKRLDFGRSVRLWQERDFVEATDLRADEDTGNTTAEGGVVVVLGRRPAAGDAGGRVELGGIRMACAPGDGSIQTEGKCTLRVGEVELSSEILRVLLRPGGGEVEKIEARLGVVVRWGPMEGRGGAALYDLDSETLVLVDNPVLHEDNKGSARGDKLTFHLADDRILIENNGQERSVTVIKS